MTKLLIEPLSKEHIKHLNNKDVAGYIVGINNYSIFQSLKLSIDDIKNLDVNGKELYVYLNKPIHNSELSSIRNILIELSKMNITGVIYEDVCIYMFNKNLNLNLNLIWGSMHLPTNSKTCNYWHDKGCAGALLSTELMVSDFINIKKNTNMIIMVYLYGHIPIMESSRTLITNYLSHINKKKECDVYNLYEKERDKFYPIYEEYDNTFILEDVLNGINVVGDLKDAGIDYIILNSLLCDSSIDKVIDEYIEALNGKKFDYKDVYTGFLFKESIFRVK